MNTQQLIEWMGHPGMLGKDASAELDDVTQRFPFFQSAQLLYIKSLHNENNFLYNNQLKVAAAYAVNRKVLYELITLKSERESEREGEKVSKQPLSDEKELSVKTSAVEENVVETRRDTSAEKVSQPKFPSKKLTNDPDEWESGMMRQLQLLHHWQTSPEEILRQRLKEIEEERKAKAGSQKTDEESVKQEVGKEIVDEEKKPTATDEINTLLYVLVEPNVEDVPTEETVAEENNWEVKELESTTTNDTVEVPEDNVDQEIIREAITSSIELEVSDALPSLEELTGVPKEQKELKISLPKFEEKKPGPQLEKQAESGEETVNSSEELSFSQWVSTLKNVDPKAEFPQEIKKETKLIDKFIQDQPRLQSSKTTFYNPVNMARKSVQDNDEFLTETLARIYAKQGNIPKAIRAYQKLSLKIPEKTAYFAALIEELKRTPTK